MLQVALACVGHERDHLALYEEYQQPGWQDTLQRYHDFFSRMKSIVIPMEHFSYHPRDTYYQSVANQIKDNPALTDVANLYMVSGSNKVIHQDEELLAINRNVNSKKHFAENAPAFGIQVPDTLVTTKAELGSKTIADFFNKHKNKIILKLLGLAGARNVTAVESITATEKYVAEYDDDMVILLQERLDLESYTEMTVDLVVSNDNIRIANTRKLLFADGLWVGNLIGSSVSVTDEQASALIRVGEYARHHRHMRQLSGLASVHDDDEKEVNEVIDGPAKPIKDKELNAYLDRILKKEKKEEDRLRSLALQKARDEKQKLKEEDNSSILFAISR